MDLGHLQRKTVSPRYTNKIKPIARTTGLRLIIMKNAMKIFTKLVFIVTLTACQSDAATPETDSTKVSDMIHKTEITVYKSPTCGCCKEWVTYLEEEGFKVTAIDSSDVDAIKVKYGLPDPELKSCHTAIVDDYIVEGHVPASDIQRLLKTRPTNIKGLSAPGMPMMSPGMASRTPKDYAVLSFTESGETAVYSQY